MRIPVHIALLALTLAGCSTSKQDFAVEPALSPVGTGVYQYSQPVAPAAFPATPATGANSLWSDQRADLFRDPRAVRVGDVVTVKIQIKDQASLENNSKRSREAGIAGSLDFDATANTKSLGTLSGTLGAKDKSDTTGKGKIDRSENIDLSVAAVVTQVMPNGNLLISGQQEVRVNFEVRVLSIAGIIRPRDILPNNTIFYDKIAEARISYGGRGRLSEVQQPGWGQQLFDAITPY